jgi:hypothetical protein
VDFSYEDLKSPGGNTVWVRPHPLYQTCEFDLAGFFVVEVMKLTTEPRGEKEG